MRQKQKIFFFSQTIIATFVSLAVFVPLRVFASTAPLSIFYYTESDRPYASAQTNIEKISVLAPQSYGLDKKGRLYGKPSPRILALARVHNIKLMPHVTNGRFNKFIMRDILQSPAAQKRAIKMLADEAVREGYWGWQFDFENFHARHKNRYSKFVRDAALAFHERNLIVSVAVVAQHSKDSKTYRTDTWRYWAGPFDYKALGQYADFITLMAYDDDFSKGPAAELPWVKKVLAFALERIPPEKLSLGIPLYYWEWDELRQKRVGTGPYQKVANLREAEKIFAEGWDETLQVPWVRHIQNGRIRKIWYENPESFRKKLELVTANNLHGFSAWALGREDPRIWEVLTEK